MRLFDKIGLKNFLFALFLAAEIILFLVVPPIGFTCESGVSPHLVYMFFHANVFHLLGNMLCLYLVTTNRFISVVEHYTVAYLIAVASSWLSCMSVPTIGLSGFVFAIIGMLTPFVYCTRNIIIIALSLALGFVIPNSNGLIHLWSFTFGFLYGLVRKGFILNIIYYIYEKTNEQN